MKKSSFLTAVLARHIIYSNSVLALPKWLFARQFCDTIACVPDDPWIDPAGLAEGIDDWFDSFKTNPLPEISPNIPKDGRQIVPASPITEPDIDLEVTAPNQGPEKCLTSPPP